MSTLVDDPQARELLLLLWNAPDRDAGIAIVDLPNAMRDEALLSACHGDGLIKLMRRKHCHTGGGAHRKLVLEKGWDVAELYKAGRTPLWQCIKEALSERVEDEVRLRVALTNRGCDVAAKLSREALGAAAKRTPDPVGSFSVAALQAIATQFPKRETPAVLSEASPTASFQVGVTGLTARQREIFQIIKSLPAPLKGNAVARRLKIKGDTFRRHHVPALTPHGLRNGPDGYYLVSI